MEAIVRMQGIVKLYDNGVLANDAVDFSLRPGEIHALAGENGAGKSTLMKILYGMEIPDAGTIAIQGSPVHFRSPQDAMRRGIGMVHQHFMLIEELSVTENLFLGIEQHHYGWLDRKAMVQTAQALCNQYQMDLDLQARVDSLSVGKKQKVEILKVLLRQATILLLDEPTAVLTPQESEELFAQLRRLKEDGHTIVIITHKLDEIQALCDRITIMRHGKNLGTYDINNISKEEISQKMVGFDVNLTIPSAPISNTEPLWEIQDLSLVDEEGKEPLHSFHLTLHSGEIVGLAGVEGNGQEELVECLTGWRKPTSGTMKLKGKPISFSSVHEARQQGIGHIPSDRMRFGGASSATIFENLMAYELTAKRHLPWNLSYHRQLHQQAKQRIQQFRIDAADEQQPLSSLSGGNIQKVVVARELSQNPLILIANQPTRGVDVGAMEFIYQSMREVRDRGAAILMVSSDLAEIFALSTRIVVMHRGTITAVIDQPQHLDEATLGQYMLGVQRQSPEGGAV